MIIAVWVAKGGTAKTETATMLATNPSLPFQERLLVDLDPQGWQSRNFDGLPSVSKTWKGATDLYLRFAHRNEVQGFGDVLVTLSDGTYYLRADRRLDALYKLWPQRGAIREPDNALKALLSCAGAESKDMLAVLDCPPGSCYSLMPRMALIAAEYIILPVTPDPQSLDGLVAAIEDLRLIRDGDPTIGEPPVNPKLKVLGVLRVRASKRDGVSKAVLNRLPGLLESLGAFAGEPIRLLDTVIRERVDVRRSNLLDRTVFQGPLGDAQEDAKALGAEVARLLGKNVEG